MNWSVGEVSALATKAVRGTGEPWGVAQEAGWAMRWLARAGLPGMAALARAVAAGDLSDLHKGIEISDRGKVNGPVPIVGEVLLIVPFLARCIPEGQAWMVRAANGQFRLWRTGSDPVPAADMLFMDGPTPLPDPLPAEVERVPHDVAAFSLLNEFAARTYAPATEASRQGAGAGLTDND